MNIGIPPHVVALGWNPPIYRAPAHTACTELDLHKTKLKLFSLYPVIETPWTGRDEGKGAALLGHVGRDIHTPKPFFLCFAPRVCVSAGAGRWGAPSLGGQQPETACSAGLETSTLPEPWCKTGARQVSLKSRTWHREWLVNSGRSRRIIKHVSSEERISGDFVTFIENFTPRTSLEKWQKQMDPVDRGENTHLLNYKKSVHIIPVKPIGNFRRPPASGSLSP